MVNYKPSSSLLYIYRYDLVRGLRAKIDASLGPLIEDEVDRHSMAPQETVDGGQETLVNRITDKVINSME